MKRMFIALELPDAVREGMVSATDKAKSNLTGLSWVKANNMHLTLKFLGDVEAFKQKDIAHILDDVAAASLPFTISYGGVGQFGRAGNTSSIWIGVKEDTGALFRLAAQVDLQCGALGFATEQKPFSPHITLARVKKPAMMPPWDQVRGLFTEWVGTVVHTGFGLYSSILTPSGPIYTKERWFEFKTSR